MTRHHGVTDDQRVRRAAGYGARWWIERNTSMGRALLTDVEYEALGVTAVAHALGTDLVVPHKRMTEEVDAMRNRADRHLSRACAAENARDRTLRTVQAALHSLADKHPELREVLAETASECVIFDPENP